MAKAILPDMLKGTQKVNLEFHIFIWIFFVTEDSLHITDYIGNLSHLAGA